MGLLRNIGRTQKRPARSKRGWTHKPKGLASGRTCPSLGPPSLGYDPHFATRCSMQFSVRAKARRRVRNSSDSVTDLTHRSKQSARKSVQVSRIRTVGTAFFFKIEARRLTVRG